MLWSANGLPRFKIQGPFILTEAPPEVVESSIQLRIDTLWNMNGHKSIGGQGHTNRMREN